LRARIYPTQIEREKLEAVLAYYDVGGLRGWGNPPAGGLRSHKLVLKTGRGRLVLKEYMHVIGSEAIRYEHSVLRHLASRGFPVPRLLPTRDGGSFVEVDGQRYAIFGFVKGFTYTDCYLSRRQERWFLRQAGQTLAQYHRRVEGFVPEGRKLDGFKPGGKSRWRDYRWHLQKLEEYTARLRERGPSAQEQRLLRELDRRRDELLAIGQAFEEQHHVLSKVIIHGDYNPSNLLFDRRGVTAVLDFECVHLDFRASDVISAIGRFFAREGPTLGIDGEKAGIFFAAYQSTYPLDLHDVILIPDIFRYARLRNLEIYLRACFRDIAVASLDKAFRTMQWIDWMSDQGTHLVEELLATTAG
jgi:homoserine kinase type II